jgi:hypothetical protein
MVVAARPDLLGAIIARLRAEADLTALTSARISGQLQDSWAMPVHAVLVRLAGGGPGKPHLAFKEQRVDVFCFGSTGFEATKVWRQLDAVFNPGQERQCSFIQSVGGVNCRVYSVVPEREPSSEIEPDSGWPRVSASYLVRWSGIAA